METIIVVSRGSDFVRFRESREASPTKQKFPNHL